MRAGWRDMLLAASLAFLAGCGGVGEPPQPEPARGAIDPLSDVAALAASCSGCHGGGGQAIASLKGRSAVELAASLEAYRSDPEGTTVMHRLARGYSEADIAAIADFLAGSANE